MKRAYEIDVERGNNHYARTYIVVAKNDEEAVRKAKTNAKKETGVRAYWRCVSLRERATELLP